MEAKGFEHRDTHSYPNESDEKRVGLIPKCSDSAGVATCQHLINWKVTDMDCNKCRHKNPVSLAGDKRCRKCKACDLFEGE